MATKKLVLRPGINVQQTPTLNEGGWATGQLIRWKDGLPQKLGGWTHLNTTAFIGTARGAHAWADLSANPRLAIGTEQRLTLLDGGVLNDITPLRKTTNPAVSFSTVINTPTVTITDTVHGAAAGDWMIVNVT